MSRIISQEDLIILDKIEKKRDLLYKQESRLRRLRSSINKKQEENEKKFEEILSKYK